MCIHSSRESEESLVHVCQLINALYKYVHYTDIFIAALIERSHAEIFQIVVACVYFQV